MSIVYPVMPYVYNTYGITGYTIVIYKFIQPCKTEWDPIMLQHLYKFHMYLS